jgi:hypothetical protein
LFTSPNSPTHPGLLLINWNHYNNLLGMIIDIGSQFV